VRYRLRNFAFAGQAIAKEAFMPRNPNPQGKGIVPVLQGLQQHWLAPVVLPKQIDQIEMELFTSLFVLQSELKFNPVPGKSYWMYETDTGYRLLLVGPDEWHKPYPGRFIGECVLQKDRTWTLMLSDSLVDDKAFMAMIETQRIKLHSALEGAEKIDDLLPAFESSLSYYGRVMAFILGRSLLTSMQLSGIEGLDYKGAKKMLVDLSNASQASE
jgi:hypothetical protein